jgi:purine-binding chemotaxis protein CheW
MRSRRLSSEEVKMTQHARSGRNGGAEELTQVCSVRAGEGLYGIRIGHVLEIVRRAHIQNVPLAPEFVGGLMLYRGDVLTTVDLRRVLGMPPYEGAQDVLVVEDPAGSFGLVVDRVLEIYSVSRADFEPTPTTLDKQRHGLFAGAYKLDGDLLVMLNPACLEPVHMTTARGFIRNDQAGADRG